MALALLFAPAFAAKPVKMPDGPEAIEVTALPIDFDRGDPDRTKFGKLIFRGGLNLFARSPYFGGYSALTIDASGTSLLAISDAGLWLRARLNHDGRRLKGLSDAVVGALPGPDGKPFATDTARDSEAVAIIDGTIERGEIYVGFERQHRILRYRFQSETFQTPKSGPKLPAEASRLDANRSIEALALLRSGPLKGALIVIPERLTDRSGNLVGWILGGPKPGTFALKRLGGFDVTDAASLPDGGLIVLERRFRYSEGVQIRIRRIAASEIKPGALVQGETLLEASDLYNIDNMEGIAAHRSPLGEIILTLTSDDNFSPLQRTLLLQFALPDDGQAKAERR